MDQPFRDYNETDILYLLMTYVNFSSGQDMYCENNTYTS